VDHNWAKDSTLTKGLKKSSLRFDIHTNTRRLLTHTLIFTINVQVVYAFNGDAAVYEPPLQVLLIIHYGRCIVRMTCIIASYTGGHGFEFLSRRLHILHNIHWPSSVPSRICRDRVTHHVTTPPFHILSTSLFIMDPVIQYYITWYEIVAK